MNGDNRRLGCRHGRFGGALSPVRADDLGAIPIAALMSRNAGVDWAAVDEVYYGCANQAGEDNRNVARMSALLAGLPTSVPGTTMNRLCGSGMDAVGTAMRAIKAGDLSPERAERTERAQLLVDSLRRADAILIGSPGYHGGISGLVKNALDYTEDMRGDARCYFDGRPVGCVATGAGWQGAVATLGALRAVVHALRGWPTPLGVAINTIEPVFAPDGECLSPDLARTLDAMAEQLLEFVAARSALATAV